MTALKTWLKKRIEKWTGTYDEGPVPPKRLRDMVHAFANLHPHATRAQWSEFAAGHAEQTYRLAFIRGVEHIERDPDWRPDPDVIADGLDPDWRLNDPFNELADPDGEVRAAWTDAKLNEDGADAVLLMNARRR